MMTNVEYAKEQTRSLHNAEKFLNDVNPEAVHLSTLNIFIDDLDLLKLEAKEVEETGKYEGEDYVIHNLAVTSKSGYSAFATYFEAKEKQEENDDNDKAALISTKKEASFKQIFDEFISNASKLDISPRDAASLFKWLNDNFVLVKK